jgi:hypothetical protein
VEIIDAWMQHPGPQFMADPMFDSLRRWKSNPWSEGHPPVEARPDDHHRPMDAVRELRRCVRDFGFKALRLVPWLAEVISTSSSTPRPTPLPVTPPSSSPS